MSLTRRRWLAQTAPLLAGAAAGTAFPAPAGEEPPPWPAFRVAPEGWGVASPRDVEAVLRSAAAELWQYFPGRSLEPFVVTRGYTGPIVHYRRNALGEIVMRLDTHDRYWCQYAYQFAHEFCHILCGFDDDDWNGNDWFEETLCETASLFVLRALARTWRERPPYPHWRTFAPQFAEYAGRLLRNRESVAPDDLGRFLRRHENRLRNNPAARNLHGTMAAALLPVFEASPTDWEAVTWLNARKSPHGQPFADYLHQWLRACPPHRRPFVRSLLERFLPSGS